MRIGPYAIEGLLGQGGMGSVYRARGPDGDVVALKVLSSTSDPRKVERFLRELRTLSQLSHPHLVEVRDVGRDGEAPYLAMRLVEGETLAARLAADGALPVPAALEIARALAAALAYAHRQGVVHRDVKPENVLLGHHGEVRLTDFGLARDEEAVEQRLTLSGAALGTPGYWAPEQARGARDALGPPTDVYGWGATLYAMLTGEPPQQVESLAQAIALSAEPVAPPSTVRGDVPRWLERVCLRCLAPDPEARFASAVELERALTPRRRRGALLGALVAATLLACGAAAWVASARWTGTPPEVAGVEEVRRSLAAEDYARAEELAGAALAREPERAELYLLRGEARFELRHLEDAELDLRRVLSLAPGTPRAEQLLGVVLASQQRIEEAEPLLRRALERDPDAPDVHVALGYVALLTGRLSEALACADAGLARGPKRRWPAHRLRGQVLAQRGDFSAAQAEFELALAEEPRHLGILLAYAVTLNSLERYAQAEAALSTALEVDPRERLARELRVKARELDGDVAGALADLRALYELDPSADRARALGMKLFELGQHPEALAVLESAKALAPTDPELLSMIGVVHGAMGNPRAALAAFELTLALDPRNQRALRNMAFAHSELGTPELAKRDLLQLLELYPENLSGRLALGLVLVELDELDDAVTLLRETLPLAPRDPELHLQLGVALCKRGELREGLLAYDRGIECAPGNLELRSRRASLRAELEDFAGALEDSERVLAARPEHVEAHVSRSLALIGLERLPEALETLERAVGLAPTLSTAWGCLGRVLRLLGRLPEAKRALDRALELQPSFDFARFQRAQVLRALGLPRDALADLEALVRAGKTSRLVRQEQVICWLFVGELEPAGATLEGLLRERPNDPELRGLQVQWFALSGRHEQAISLADQILARHPRQVEALQFACLAALELGRHERALAYSDGLMSLGGGSPRPCVIRATILHAMGRTAEAKQALDEALRRAPRDVATYSLRAKISAQLGDYPAALADCARAQELDPRDAHAILAEGEVLALQGDAAGVARCLERARPLLHTPVQRERYEALVGAAGEDEGSGR
ncbi:MAG: tetratricopeptide repeat protein [Planctomycetota bacterium]